MSYPTVDEAANATDKGSTFPATGGRRTARTELEEYGKRLRWKAGRVDALLKALPAELPREADDALWDLVTEAHRR